MTKFIVAAMGVALLGFCTAGNLSADTTAAFDGGADTPVTLEQFGAVPGPSIKATGGNPGGFLAVSEAIDGQHNWATFDNSDPGTFGAATFSFDFKIEIELDPSADGFSFSFADTATYGSSGGIGAPPFTAEDPAAAGILGFGFDTWSNNDDMGAGGFDVPGIGTGSDYSEISVFYDGALVSRVDDTRALPVSFALDDGQWHEVNGTVDFAGGTVSLAVDGQAMFTDLAVPGLAPFESRIMFAARTGGENELAGIDNLNVQFVPEPVSGVLALLGFAMLGLLRRRRIG